MTAQNSIPASVQRQMAAINAAFGMSKQKMAEKGKHRGKNKKDDDDGKGKNKGKGKKK